MTPPVQSGPLLAEWLLRLFAVAAYVFAVRNLFGVWWADRGRLTVLLLLLTEGYTLALILFARRARVRDASIPAVAINLYAALSYVLFDPHHTTLLVPELAATALQVIGALWQLSAKISLGRSFGVLPAQRGLVFSGPYRVVRHPIYLGYFVIHMAFLLANFSWRNFLVIAVLYIVQLLRIKREERCLVVDVKYVGYTKRVRWRLVPGIY